MVVVRLLLVLVLASCGSAPPAPEVAPSTAPGGGRAVDVELDVFSGKPNPTWSLSPADADAFTAKVGALPAASPTALDNPLGYRGFLVHVRAQGVEVAVQKGSVQSTAGGTTTYLGDPGRALERWLLDTGRPSLSPELVDAVERSLR